jgi:hypothetical protein
MLPLLLGMLFAPGPAPGYDPQPFLRLEPGGPTTQVTALAFSPDGELL